MDQKIKEQILKVREKGVTNMFDIKAVQYYAYHMNLFELVNYLNDHRKEYVEFILYGKH